MAYGFGGATGAGDPRRSTHDFFSTGVLKLDSSPGAVRTGRLVYRSAAGKIKVAGDEATNVLGVCGKRTLEATSGDRNGKYDYSTSFLVNDEVEVHVPMGGALVEVNLASGNNGSLGDKVVPAANGEVKLYAPDVTGTVNQTTVNTAIAENAAIVGTLMEDKDASSAAAAVLIRWGGV